MSESRSSDVMLAIQHHTQSSTAPGNAPTSPRAPDAHVEVDRFSTCMRQAAQATAANTAIVLPRRATSVVGGFRLCCSGRRGATRVPTTPPTALTPPHRQVCAQTGLALLLSALVAEQAPVRHDDIDALKQLLERYFLREYTPSARLRVILERADTLAVRHDLPQTAALAGALLQGLTPNDPTQVLQQARALVTPQHPGLWTYTSSQARWLGAQYALYAPVRSHIAEQVSWLIRAASLTLRRPLQQAAYTILGDPALSYAKRLAALDELKRRASWTDDGRRALGQCIKVLHRGQPLGPDAQRQAILRAQRALRRPEQAFVLADQLETLECCLSNETAKAIDAHVKLVYETLLTQSALGQLPQDMFAGWNAFARLVADRLAQTAPKVLANMVVATDTHVCTTSDAVGRAPQLNERLTRQAHDSETLMAQVALLMQIAQIWLQSVSRQQGRVINALWTSRVNEHVSPKPTGIFTAQSAEPKLSMRLSQPAPVAASRPKPAQRFCADSFALAYLYADMPRTLHTALPLAHLMLGAAFEGVYAGRHSLTTRVWPMQIALDAHGLTQAPPAPPSYAEWWTQMQPAPYVTTAHKRTVELLGTHLEDTRRSVLGA